ncbi:MAG: hypothetical protein IKF38_04550 [Clostridia bacterium]|nr:hypothetical protein [Clostridia bacterium]
MKIRVKNEAKAIIIAFIFLFTVIYGYWYFIFFPILSNWHFENEAYAFVQENQEPIFKIKEIILYSSAYANDNSKGEILRDLDLHQFTDISIMIDNKSYISDLSNKNTVSELYIDNIKITKNSDKGEATLNYKNPYVFGKYQDSTEQSERIDFNILHTNADNENNDFSTPTFFTDCSNPITLGYLNKNIKNNAEILKSDEKVDFNGKLLKLANVPIEDISYKLNFQIHLKNSLEESYVYTVDLNVPLEDNNSSIYDGYIFKVMHNQSKSYFFLKDNSQK